MTHQRNGKPTKARGYQSQLLEAMGSYLPYRGLPLMTDDKRVRWTDRLLEVLIPALRSAGIRAAGPAWRWGRWVVMAVDGTRIDCPRTVSNERAFGCAGRKKTCPQQLLTTVFHIPTGLVWAWRRGRGDVAERTHLREMIASLPLDVLLLADAGFTGFDLLGSLMDQGRAFLIRVGANVTLLRELGYAVVEDDGTVYLWPHSKRDAAPLVLRLIRLRDGRKRCCLLTSILDPAMLSDAEAKVLYRMRWKAEVGFRSLKQTMRRRKMLSTVWQNAQVELDWAMMDLWLLGLMAVGQVTRRDKGRVSVAAALRSVRQWMRRRSGRPPAKGLRGALRAAAVDRYKRTRPKKARDYPQKKREKPPGTPKVRMATETEVRKAKGLRHANRAA